MAAANLALAANQPAPLAVPGAPVLMVAPEPIPGVPAGLEYLSKVDQLLIHQQMEVLEMVTSWETANSYQIKNTAGQQVYFAGEESGACARQCCGPKRAFVMHISDNFGKEVIRVRRDWKCCATSSCLACCDCCSMDIKVEAPPGSYIGAAKQACSICSPTYDIVDASGTTALRVEGPMCFCQMPCCPRDIEFKITAAGGGQKVGKISKQWTGIAKEAFTDADNFGVNFPPDLDVTLKAVLLGTVFLIDFMYFEKNPEKKDKDKPLPGITGR